MIRHLFAVAFFLGALVVVWVGTGFIPDSFLALMMTLFIGAAYVFGALELRQFRQVTATVTAALAVIPDPISDLDGWLGRVHASLRNAVRLRIEGERVGLPGPVLTPYLVGLLVMLGMLGTFLGMVVTLNGAVFALQKTTDLEAMRAALAVPVQGLGLAFGTSVAGVAASAMLGLMSALCRRERMLAAQLLDAKIATHLRSFSLTYQRQEAFKALQSQSRALPEMVDKMQAMMEQMTGMNQQMGQELSQRLLGNQQSFHSDVKAVHFDLARSVDLSLRDTLGQSARMAGESIKPVVEAAMRGIAQEAGLVHERIADTVANKLDVLSERFGAQQRQICETLTQTATDITDHAQVSAGHTLREATRLINSAEELMRSRIASEARWIEQHSERMDQLAGLLRSELGALRDDEALRGQAAVDRLGQLQIELTRHLTTLGTALEEPITRLIETASEAPRAAAEVIGRLREEISSGLARDNALLEERTRIMATLNALLEAINHASVEQRAVIDSLVASSAVALDAAGSAFSDNVATEAAKLADIAAHVTTSAVEVSSLSAAFAFAVQSFNEANEKLIDNLQRIEGAMDKSMLRSDEQLAYYVAQAREIIDLSMSSQKDILDELRQLPAKQVVFGQEAG